MADNPVAKIFYKIREKCKSLESKYNNTKVLNDGWCGPAWDGIMCWYETPPNTLASASCPQYFGFSPNNNATKFCAESGKWFVHETLNTTWTNYSNCIPISSIKNSASVNISLLTELKIYEIWIPRIHLVQYTGYSLSIIFLLSAMIIFTQFKKLKCPRNTLHLNVFISFFLKAAMFFIKEFILVNGTVMKDDLVTDKTGGTYVKEQNSWICKANTSFGQYIIVTNYMLLLMEGVYLYRLLFSPCPDYRVKHLILFGWLSPFVSVIPWAITKALYHNELCWTTHGNLPYQYIIHVPIILATLTNFMLFIKIIRILAAKLHVGGQNQYRKLIRGTLVLMPLFGVPYTVSIITWYPALQNTVHELAWIAFDQTFTSMQGACVALSYCFLSSDVRNELKTVFCKCKVKNLNLVTFVEGQHNLRRVTH